jgi:hypothetical protein
MLPAIGAIESDITVSDFATRDYPFPISAQF